MQLIMDTETSIDIKRNMSILNEESLSEKIDDVIQDLKSGLCNGNKENIQSRDNMISCEDRSNLDDDKISAVILNSPENKDNIGKENSIEATEHISTEILNEQVKDNVVENASEDSLQEINKESPTVTEDKTDINNKSDLLPIQEKDTGCSQIEESKQTGNKDETGCENEIVEHAIEHGICNGYEEQSEIKKSDDVVEMAEGIHEKVNEKFDDDKIDVDDDTREVDNKIKQVKPVDIDNIPDINGKVDEIVKHVDETTLKVIEEVKENVNITDNLSSDEIVDTQHINNEGDKTVRNNIHVSEPLECLDASPNHNIPNSSSNLLLQNDEINTEKVTTDVNTPKAEEIETVDLDEDEKDTEISEKGCNENVPEISSTNSVTDKPENIVADMETVDLDDEKDVSTIEPMDVDVNDETGETEIKELPFSMSSKNEDIVNLDSDDKLDDSDLINTIVADNTESTEIITNITQLNEQSSNDYESANNSLGSEGDQIEKPSSEPIDISDDGVKEQDKNSEPANDVQKTPSSQNNVVDELKNIPPILKLSNTLDILSDDEDDVAEPSKTEQQAQIKESESAEEKQCINIDDDDDIMLIDEDDVKSKEDIKNENKAIEPEAKPETTAAEPTVNNEANEITGKTPETISKEDEKVEEKEKLNEETVTKQQFDEIDEKPQSQPEPTKPLVPNNFLQTCKKNMAEMTRDDLEEFCILKIVESVVDRSSLSEIKSKLKSMAQCIEEYKRKAVLLTKQNRDLQVVLKTIQEEQKNSKTVTPLKITRSVGMQVLMTERSSVRRKTTAPVPQPSTPTNTTTPQTTKSPRAANQRAIKVPAAPSPQQIPVPRLIPASNSPAAKSVPQVTNNTAKAASPVNGVRNNVQKAEKRSLNRNHSVTVDLTDDEPPTKMINRNSTPTPVRVVPPHMVPPSLLAAAPRHPLGQNPRKVYIPISGPQGNARPGQAIVLKSVTSPSQSPRPRAAQPHLARLPQSQIRMSRVQSRHPAPLPESTKQYPGTYLKALPPAPDLKLSKVENGIVISWKIEGYQEDSYEEIASYQLYAYQETSSPPSTALWKKIGDVKALPLPMACTLTQFMAGFKYYFAVRAVDIRSRIGPFSLPGSILLLNKL